MSITCDPSFSASNEIHVCIVSVSSAAAPLLLLYGSIRS